jgi:hypothetical protein
MFGSGGQRMATLPGAFIRHSNSYWIVLIKNAYE